MNDLITFDRDSLTFDFTSDVLDNCAVKNGIALIEAVEDNGFQELSFDVADLVRPEINSAGSDAMSIDFSSQVNAPYSNIYVFGDSLSDMGNVFNATSFLQEPLELFGLDIPVVPPSPPYFEGRFSNGPLWVEMLALELNIDLTPVTELSIGAPGSNIPSPMITIDGNPVVISSYEGITTEQSVNFAFGFAQTGANGSGELGEFIPGMERQVDFFVIDHLLAQQAADPQALYILWGGSNDYLGSDADPEEVVENLETEIESLYGVGARDFLVVNLPDLGETPLADTPDFPLSPEELTALTETHNSLLNSTIDELEDSLSGASLTILDVNSKFDEVIDNPEEFGLTNVTDSFLDPTTLTPTPGANPNEYFFYDLVHPTEVGHQLTFDTALETLGIESDILV